MLLTHPELTGRAVRLGYCMNLHAADDLAGTLAGIRSIAVPLAERFEAGRLAEGFGVGLYLPAAVAQALLRDRESLDALRRTLADARLDPFTFNAFPYGGFHREGLKAAVFRPTWSEPERGAFTLAVAELATRLGSGARHLSVSTHTGAFAAWIEDDAQRDAIADAFVRVASGLAELERTSGRRVVLALEPEPRSLANDTGELMPLVERIGARAGSRRVAGRESGEHAGGQGIIEGDAQAGEPHAVARHLGTCLDTCHAAVEFEAPEAACANATPPGWNLGKLQFSSALALLAPGERPDARARLVALDEPVYLHQVTGRAGGDLLRVGDLPELPLDDPAWLGCDEWRCHFHVPVDLVDAAGLATTRPEADALLDAVLAAPERWGTDELHVEIETYTWDVLPAAARGPGELVDGLEREYAHVLGRLARAGWKPA